MIKVGISSCLVGQEVRYNATHCYDSYLVEVLGKQVHLVPVCPEMEVGMGTPRETVRLVGGADDPQMIAPDSMTDWTSKMQEWAVKRIGELRSENLSGFVFKDRSPSCGLFHVKVYPKNGPVKLTGRGLFAAELVRQYPSLPVTDAELLQELAERQEFLQRIKAYNATS